MKITIGLALAVLAVIIARQSADGAPASSKRQLQARVTTLPAAAAAAPVSGNELRRHQNPSQSVKQKPRGGRRHGSRRRSRRKMMCDICVSTGKVDSVPLQDVVGQTRAHLTNLMKKFPKEDARCSGGDKKKLRKQLIPIPSFLRRCKSLKNISSEDKKGREMEIIAFVLKSVLRTNKRALMGALNLTSADIDELDALLRDDHHGICIIRRILNKGQSRRKAKCRRPRITNRHSVKTLVVDMLYELSDLLESLL